MMNKNLAKWVSHYSQVFSNISLLLGLKGLLCNRLNPEKFWAQPDSEKNHSTSIIIRVNKYSQKVWFQEKALNIWAHPEQSAQIRTNSGHIRQNPGNYLKSREQALPDDGVVLGLDVEADVFVDHH